MLLSHVAGRLMAAASYVSPALSALFFRRRMLRPRRSTGPSRPVPRPADERIDVHPGLVAWRWGSGPRVLLVHGWEGHHGNFAPLIEALAAQGFSAIALDMPAHGASAGREANVAMFVTAVTAALDRIGPVEAVIGHSMGGAAALQAVAGRTDVGRAVALAAPTSLERVLRRFGAAARLSRRGIDAFVRAIERRVGVPARDFDVRLSAPRLTLPILLVHDQHDREIPVSDAARSAHVLSHARLVVTETLGHRRLLRDPGVVRTCVEFVMAAGAAERQAA